MKLTSSGISKIPAQLKEFSAGMGGESPLGTKGDETASWGISVIICTHNRLELLEKCLESLKKQNYSQFEIIVVNDASTDGTDLFLASYEGIKIITHERNLGLSPSRNDGIKAALNDLIAFTDDDCCADPNWLLEIAKSFSAKGGSVSGWDFAAGQTFLENKNYIGRFPQRVVTNIGARWPKGNNLIFSRKVFNAIGLFNPEMDYYGNYDSEIAIRAVSVGFKFLSLPQAIVYHQITYWTVPALLKSARNPSVWVLLKKKYPKHYRHFFPPVKLNVFVHPEDYLYILAMPLLLPLLLIRFMINGQREFKLFFAKWPVYPFLRRFYIYREAVKNRVFLV